MTNVLYISYDGMTDPLGQSQVIPYLQGLSAAGYSITLLSCEKPERYLQGKAAIQQLLDAARIQWVPLMYTKQPPLLSTIYDIIKMRQRAVALHKQYNFDIIHCRSYISALTGLYMKRRFGTRFIFDMRGFWANERVDGGLWNLQNPLYKAVYDYFKRKEIDFLKKADYTISLTYNGRNEILSWPVFKDKPINIEVIPCCADLNLFDYRHLDENRLNDIKSALGIKETDFIINYSGAIGTWYLLPDMLRFFKVLKSHIPGARFMILTAESHTEVLAQAHMAGVAAEDLIVQKVARTDMPYYLACSQVAVFFIKAAFSKKASSPTKQGEIMGMGIPIICNGGIGDTDKVINEYNAGIVINDLTDQNFEDVVKNMDTLLHIPRTTIRHGAEDFYALNTGIQRYKSVYDKLTNRVN